MGTSLAQALSRFLCSRSVAQSSPRHDMDALSLYIYISRTLTAEAGSLDKSPLALFSLTAYLTPQLGHACSLLLWVCGAAPHSQPRRSPDPYRVLPGGVRTLTCGSIPASLSFCSTAHAFIIAYCGCEQHAYFSCRRGLSSLLGCNNMSVMRHHFVPPARRRTSAVGCSISIDFGFHFQQEQRLALLPHECFIPTLHQHQRHSRPCLRCRGLHQPGFSLLSPPHHT